ncbi:MAG: dihydrolipoyl dehydrogenase [Desulfuromonadales bacterium]|nr:dihydrolipoyl dehydrogenase [Desulfuromonadales bacterium]
MENGKIYDLIVIGAGPGGYTAAIRGAQLGMSVAVIEKRNRPGGVCLNEGCIPSKAFLDSSEYFALARDKFATHGINIEPPKLDLERMMQRKDDIIQKNGDGILYLFKKHKIDLINGKGALAAREGELHRVEVTDTEKSFHLEGKNILLATGSRAVEIPAIPFDGELIVSAREALSFSEPPEHLLVVGAGYIGLELGSIWKRLGSEVTVVEALPKPLASMDSQVVDTLIRALKKQGLRFFFETTVKGFSYNDGKVNVDIEGVSGTSSIKCSKVLVAVGRAPYTEALNLPEAGIETDNSGRIIVDENYETSAKGVHAIGDIIAGPMLAHKASEEAVAAVESLNGRKSKVDYSTIPGICYTWPEVASVGRSEEQLVKEGIPYSVGKFSFIANGRARCLDETEGFVKIIAHTETDKILGVHIVGPKASELIAEAVIAMTLGATASDMAKAFHAHPTLSEAVKEAALDVHGEAIHI